MSRGVLARMPDAFKKVEKNLIRSIIHSIMSMRSTHEEDIDVTKYHLAPNSGKTIEMGNTRVVVELLVGHYGKSVQMDFDLCRVIIVSAKVILHQQVGCIITGGTPPYPNKLELLRYRNRLEQGIAHKPVIIEVFHDLRDDYRVVYHDLYLGGPTEKGVGLRVASSHTGNHCEDDFTPLETIRRFLGKSIYLPLSMDTKFIIASQTCTLTKDELSKLVTNYDIPQDVRVSIPEFICEVLNYFKVHISCFNPSGMIKLTTFAIMCKAYGGEPSLGLLRAFLNLGPA
ncbi:hypothetical protein Tco_0199842 [Tanacetum coccineum]